MKHPPSIVWFRHDLRLDDQPALLAASRRGPVVPVFIWAPHEEGDWPLGTAARWWLHHSLEQFDASLRRLGSRLIVRQGDSLAVLRELVAETGAKAVYWNRRYEPASIARDTAVKAALKAEGLVANSSNGSLLVEPWTLPTPDEGPFQVFQHFWEAFTAQGRPTEPVAGPANLWPPTRWPSSLAVADLGLLTKRDGATCFRTTWRPGEEGGRVQLKTFADEAVGQYATARNRPDLDAGSRLSPFLRWGEVSPRRVWQTVRDRVGPKPSPALRRNLSRFQQELAWREFSYYLLVSFPRTVDEPLKPEFAKFPYRKDAPQLKAWQQGKTGYPLVDAGMRQLWKTGWMHNRVRMVAASFLTKHLLLDWRHGARWFWDTLVDADLASNTYGWQWSAGTGADAAPYFRIFNPTLQATKFDPQGDYIRRWVPELAGLPDEHLAEPWKAPGEALRTASLTPGVEYPFPLVEHAAARRRALDAYEGVLKK